MGCHLGRRGTEFTTDCFPCMATLWLFPPKFSIILAAGEFVEEGPALPFSELVPIPSPGWLHRIFYLTASPSPPPDQPASDHVTDGSMFSFSPLLNCFPAPKNHRQQTKQKTDFSTEKFESPISVASMSGFFLLNLSGKNVRFFTSQICTPANPPPLALRHTSPTHLGGGGGVE